MDDDVAQVKPRQAVNANAFGDGIVECMGKGHHRSVFADLWHRAAGALVGEQAPGRPHVV